jgi:hypothetical protein
LTWIKIHTSLLHSSWATRRSSREGFQSERETYLVHTAAQHKDITTTFCHLSSTPSHEALMPQNSQEEKCSSLKSRPLFYIEKTLNPKP